METYAKQYVLVHSIPLDSVGIWLYEFVYTVLDGKISGPSNYSIYLHSLIRGVQSKECLCLLFPDSEMAHLNTDMYVITYSKSYNKINCFHGLINYEDARPNIENTVDANGVASDSFVVLFPECQFRNF